MWEAIAANRRRSMVLIFLMGAILVGLGFAVGYYAHPEQGGLIGAAAAVVLWLILTATAFFQGNNILLSTAGAQEIEKQDFPMLWNVVEEMTIASGGGAMPRVYIINDPSPNAFAVGRNLENSAIAVTAGLLVRLNRDELQGVIAHEMGHIRNQDVRFMTIAGVMLGTIILISETFLRMLIYTGGGRSRRRSRSSEGGGQAQVLIFVAIIVAAVLAPVFAQVLYFACSRKREYLADASSARYTRYPTGLASALEKISRGVGSAANVSKVLAPMYIVNPLKGLSSVGLFSTHPSTEKRVQVLRAMGGGAGFGDYDAAYRKVEGKRSRLLSEQTLKMEGVVSVREASAESEDLEDQNQRARKLSELLGFMTGMVVVNCDCGMGIRIPPAYSRSEISCPRCGTAHPVPSAASSKSGTTGKTRPKESPAKPSARPLQYQRKSDGWETFRCQCGHTLQMSPRFKAPFIRCPNCKSRISIE